MQRSILLLVLLSSIRLFGQDISDSESRIIIWNENNKLKWCDFKVNYHSQYEDSCIAYSCLTILGYYYKSDSDIMFDVYNLFIEDWSWRTKDLSGKLLIHEQGHFDISEYYTRLIRKYLSENTDNYSVWLKNKVIYDMCLTMCLNTHKLYDLKTNHGDRGIVQKKYLENIRDSLKSLEDFYKQSYTDDEIKRLKFTNSPK